jgi:hypothetical protein
LLSATFKKKLLAFLKNEWMSQVYESSRDGHKLYFATGQDCFLYVAVAETSRGATSMSYKAIMKEPIQGSYSMPTSLPRTQKNMQTPTIVVRSIDTDAFVLLLHHAQPINVMLWMDAGINSKNKR